MDKQAGGNAYGTSVTVDQNGKIVKDFSAVQVAVKHKQKAPLQLRNG